MLHYSNGLLKQLRVWQIARLARGLTVWSPGSGAWGWGVREHYQVAAAADFGIFWRNQKNPNFGISWHTAEKKTGAGGSQDITRSQLLPILVFFGEINPMPISVFLLKNPDNANFGIFWRNKKMLILAYGRKENWGWWVREHYQVAAAANFGIFWWNQQNANFGIWQKRKPRNYQVAAASFGTFWWN